jgi:N-acetylmuramidase/Putative peptidoglycan binding domain
MPSPVTRIASAVANEIIADGAARALATHDWRTFVRIYNSPNYAKNNYDNTIRTWYEKFNGGASPDLRIRSAQVYLMYLGFEPSDIDGIFGKRTRSAMNEYQSRNHLQLRTSSTTRRLRRSTLTGRPFRGVSWRRAGNNRRVRLACLHLRQGRLQSDLRGRSLRRH